MRRFVKALSFKRDKSDNPKSTLDAPNNIDVASKKGRKPSHSLRIKSFIPISSSPLTSSPSTPQLSVSSDHPHSSSASSSAGSVDFNLQTPVDDHLGSTIKNKSWNMLVISKKTSPVSTTLSHRVDVTDGMSARSESEASMGAYDQPHNIAVHHLTLKQNMRVLIENKQLPIPVSYPFASSSIGPSYPRSCNRSADLPRKRSIRYIMFQKRLLQFVDETPSSRKPIPINTLVSLPSHVTTWPSNTYQITSFSLGIRRWISRPYFEDTHDEYLPSEEGIVTRRISGSSLGVAVIDYSEELDILACPDYYISDTPAASANSPVPIVPPPTQLNPETAPLPQPSLSSNLMMSSSILVRNHVSAVPSPLRNDALSSTSDEKEGGSRVEITPSPPLVRRGVHFAEDDDTLPLHIVRIKKKREEKARFLRSENRRRELEARQTMKAAEEERRRGELEQMEREKVMQERKAKEEERKQHVYLDQVSATRLRREANRIGASSDATGVVSTSSSSASIRDLDHSSKSREARHRPNPIYVPPVSQRASSSPGTPPQAPGSSRPPSVTGQPASASGDKRSSVRPASLHSTRSSEDVQSRRNSTIAQAHRSSAMRNLTYPMLFATPIPPVAVMSPYMMPIDPSLTMDTPLLPPVRPFAMQQYARRSSGQSSPGQSNSSSSRIGTSNNSSSERLDQSSRFGYSAPPSPSSSRSSGFFTASPSARRSGISNAEFRRASMPLQVANNDHSETASATRSQPLSSSRGRLQSVSQQQIQLPSPWTALPTQTGRLPVMMPRTRQGNQALTPSHSHNHRQTFIL